MSAALLSLMRHPPDQPMRPGALKELVQFLTIGAGAALLFVVLSSVIISLRTGVENWVVNTACYGLMIVPVYLLHRRYSFQSDAAHRQALPRYMAVQGMALLLAALFSYVIHGVLTVPALTASILVIALTSGINFMVLRSWAFARQRMARVALA